MSILKHLDKNNLHHAYLIEGMRGEILPELLKFIEVLGVKTSGNSDFIHISLDSFKIEDARNLKSYGAQKGFSESKKIFIITANSFLLEAQNSLLKMFEEPILNTHFFLITPDTNSLLKTFISRFYFIKGEEESNLSTEEAENFIAMPLKSRIDFIKELLVEPEEDEDLPAVLDSTRSKAIQFLNSLEVIIYRKFLKNSEWCRSQPVLREGLSQKNFLETFAHIFKVREFLRMPGSSTKSLMESVALIIPNF